MRETLIVLVGLGLLAGGCSLSSPGGPVATGTLREDPAPLVISSEAPENLGPAIDDNPDRPAVATRGGFEPLASLDASERARNRWEELDPSDSGKGHTATGVSEADTSSTLAAATATRSGRHAYDRNAAMQGLVDGGKRAGKRICDGC